MPLPMVHLAVARNIVESGFHVDDLPGFYLGVISPDAIHMRKNADRLAKHRTHLIPEGRTWEEIDVQDYFKFLQEFIESGKDNVSVSFLWGYCIHILTDLIWTKSVYLGFIDKYRNDPAPVQDERWAYYNDTDILDFELFRECSWREDVWEYLQRAGASDFLDLLSADEIKSWNERTLHWYDSGESYHKNPVKYITKQDVISFISDCAESILKLIGSKSL